MMNFQSFKKSKEDAKTVTITHPSGHSITILKSKITPEQKAAIMKMAPHLDEGGGPDDEEAAPEAAPPPAMPSPPPAPFMGSPGADELNHGASGSWEPAPPATSGGGAQTVDPSPQSQAKSNLQNNGVDIVGAYQQGQKAISEQRDLAVQLAKKQADVEQNQLDARNDLQTNADQNLQDFSKHQKDFQDYVANNPINPNHYQENMGTGQKVATAIGLLLGGFTGGFNRTGVNPASDWLNGQINRDIEGQRARLDQQKTVLGANQELYHDQVLANNATRVNMNDLYDHQLKQAAAQLGTPAAQAAYDQQHSQFALQNSQLLQQNAVRGAAIQAIKRGGAGLDPITLGNAGFIPQQEAEKEQSALDAHKIGVQRINSLYADANNEQTANSNLINPQSYKRINSINSELDALFMTLPGVPHRYSAESAKALLTPNHISTFDTDQTRAVKQNNILQAAQAAAAGSLPYFSRVAPAAIPQYAIPDPNQKYIQAARQRLAVNPNDQVAQKALQLNGIGPQKVAR